jgi:hypothetical protein
MEQMEQLFCIKYGCDYQRVKGLPVITLGYAQNKLLNANRQWKNDKIKNADILSSETRHTVYE